MTGSVNPNQLGTNILTYTVTDPGGNTTTSNRTVLVTGLATISNVGASLTGTNAGLGSPNGLLSGTVNPNGMPAVAWFQYGLSASYGAASPPVILPLSFSGSNLVFASNGLLPGVVYHYRIVATNTLGTAASPDQTLSAPAVGAPGDLNGDGIVDQHELNIVLSNYWPNSPWLYMTNVMKLESGLFQFSLTNQSAWDFSVLVSTNLADWSPLGPAYPVYQFVDPLTNGPIRYYRLRWP